ncbi:polysaccharide deacetylase family protein [Paenibacillus sp. SYP-B3998]|nr:polysaccharide deacetylase family protein [Paenibacillus sp. SYP-B3998]
MKYLAVHHFTPLTLNDFTLILQNQKAAPPRPVLLTFDDGYANNAELAMPILRQYNFPATLFISLGAVGQPGYLSWPQIKEMHAAGWDIQPHTVTHPHLPLLDADKQREEIMHSRQQLEEQLGGKADVFAFPYGEYNEETLKILREAGFRYAFTTQEGRVDSSLPPLELPRIVVYGDDYFRTWKKKLLRPAS